MCVFAYLFICICVCVHIKIYICIYVYAHTNTYTYKHMHKQLKNPQTGLLIMTTFLPMIIICIILLDIALIIKKKIDAATKRTNLLFVLNVHNN